MEIKRRALRHDVRDGLVRAIIHGDYGPRDRLIEMQAEVDAMAETAARQDVQGAVEHSERFHRIIIEASGNRLLANVWSGLAITDHTALTMVALEVEATPPEAAAGTSAPAGLSAA